MFSRARARACVFIVTVFTLAGASPFRAAIAHAQGRVRVTGLLLNSVTGAPVAGTVTIDELKQQVTVAPDGTFTFEGVPPGKYHVTMRAEKFRTARSELDVVANPPMVTLTIDPEIHYEEVVSVSPDARSAFESYQPTTVLAGQELDKQLEMSLGESLENQPGLASRSFGPAPARPVIRGLDGDRVLILQDGQRVGDLSSQSGDHGVSINPAAAQKIEVVRGPATLLYGANAIGGLVNVITDEIPSAKQDGASGNFTVDLGTAAAEAGLAGDVHWGNGKVALHAGGGGRRSSDVDTPLGDVVNSQSRNGMANLGLSWTGEKSYFGGSYGYDDTKYGIPVVEDGQVSLTPRKHSFSLRSGAENLDGAISSFRATLGVRRYRHDELEGDEVGTQFTNHTTEVEVLAGHRAFGRLKGSIGGWALDRAFDARGEEALSPAVDQRGYAGFIYEELTWPHVTVQFGGRLDHTKYDPAEGLARNFTEVSTSAGLLLQPAAANDRVTIAFSVARAARNPALEELYFFGDHVGNFAFEIGDPHLSSERGIGFDASLRWRTNRASGEITYFRNAIDDYIFRNPITVDEYEARLDELAVRFPDRDLESGTTTDLQIIEYTARDSVLQGVEAHSDVTIFPQLVGEIGVDYVRGSLRDTGEALPRIPPFRVRAGLRYQHNAFQAGGEVVAAADQDRVFGDETPTAGYTLGKVYASYSFQTGPTTSTVTARLDNVGDALYRNHLSLIKDFVPEMGRNFKLLYNVRF
jgi:iron complex outermembrane receptor protein